MCAESAFRRMPPSGRLCVQERLAALLEERKKMVEKPLEQSGSKGLAKDGHKVYHVTHPIMRIP